MAAKTTADNGYERFTSSLKSGELDKFYIFHGEERYLLEHSLAQLRKLLCPQGLEGFNYRRFEGKTIDADILEAAVDTLPVFAKRTLIEVHDLDVFVGRKKGSRDADETDDPVDEAVPEVIAYGNKNSAKQRFSDIFSDLPDYACLVLVFDTLPYKPDTRTKADKAIIANAQIVDFALQEQPKLTRWITMHFEAAGKRISRADAEYLSLITDGYMSALFNEIAKISAYANDDLITRSDIDAVVTPVLNAFAYKLTDAILARKHSTAMIILDELLRMREPPHKILYSISAKMRQFMAARICFENKLGKKVLMDMSGIRYDFQATALLDTARKTSLAICSDAVLICTEAAYDLNSAPEPEERLVELVLKLAFNGSKFEKH